MHLISVLVFQSNGTIHTHIKLPMNKYERTKTKQNKLQTVDQIIMKFQINKIRKYYCQMPRSLFLHLFFPQFLNCCHGMKKIKILCTTKKE